MRLFEASKGQQEAAIRPRFASSKLNEVQYQNGMAKTWRNAELWFLARGSAEHEVNDHYISELKGNLRVIKAL